MAAALGRAHGWGAPAPRVFPVCAMAPLLAASAMTGLAAAHHLCRGRYQHASRQKTGNNCRMTSLSHPASIAPCLVRPKTNSPSPTQRRVSAGVQNE